MESYYLLVTNNPQTRQTLLRVNLTVRADLLITDKESNLNLAFFCSPNSLQLGA